MNRPIVAAALLAWVLAGCGAGDRSGDVVIFAAASLRDVCEDLRPALREATGREPLYNFAGSNVLARQIEAAPVADVFLSAHERWVDWLQEAGRLAPETRRAFASNRLVIVVRQDSALAMVSPRDLATSDFRFLSMGDPDAVPAGIYAKGYLQSVDLPGGGSLWDAVRERVAPAPDVRAALGMVEARRDVVGLVYATDARQSDEVRVLLRVPSTAAPPIRYVAAVVAGGPAGEEEGRQVLEALSSPRSREVLRRHGFDVPPEAEDP